jgi:tagatose 1,6-diphosphate aldolase
MAFAFLDPGPLVDRELQLVAPDPRWFDDVLAACSHPLTLRDAPLEAQMTREKLVDLLKRAPAGRQMPNARGLVPSYSFWMRIAGGAADVRIAGGISLRIGCNAEIELYSGNVGYHVYPPARGRHYAERACRLLLPLARRHGLHLLWITCNPENAASKRTCERLGAKFVDVVPIPPEHPFRTRGETAKCRYVLDLSLSR